MRWRGRRESDNVEDQRGQDGGGGMGGLGGGGFGGGGFGMGRRTAVGGLGTVLIVVVALIAGVDPTQLFQGTDSGMGGSVPSAPARRTAPTTSYTAEEQELAGLVKVVLADNEDVWSDIMRRQGKDYRFPKLVLFSRYTRSACGGASAQTGPFYCPADEKIYIDLSFYQEMKNKFKADGDFAMAYVISHEVGHHVQKVLGISDRVQRLQQGGSRAEANRLSVKLELQADFLAGVWAHYDQKTKNILEEGDIEEAFRIAQAIGDDRLQMQAQGYVAPESFTHGTSKERLYWFRRGFETGDLRNGDTFNSR